MITVCCSTLVPFLSVDISLSANMKLTAVCVLCHVHAIIHLAADETLLSITWNLAKLLIYDRALFRERGKFTDVYRCIIYDSYREENSILQARAIFPSTQWSWTRRAIQNAACNAYLFILLKMIRWDISGRAYFPQKRWLDCITKKYGHAKYITEGFKIGEQMLRVQCYTVIICILYPVSCQYHVMAIKIDYPILWSPTAICDIKNFSLNLFTFSLKHFHM